MRHRLLGVAALGLGILAAMSAVSHADALSCVHHEDVEQAARDALAGEHPLWADRYIVARLERVEREDHEPLTLTVTPTHAFGHQLTGRMELTARSDGPPDPGSWHVGRHYFLALEAQDRADGQVLVSPCAPNFEIADAAQLERLIGSAPMVTTVDPHVVLGSAPPPPLVVLVGAGAIGLASILAFRWRSRGSR